MKVLLGDCLFFFLVILFGDYVGSFFAEILGCLGYRFLFVQHLPSSHRLLSMFQR